MGHKERVSTKSVKSLGNSNYRIIHSAKHAAQSISDMSASQNQENGLRSSHASRKNFEAQKVTSFTPYLPSGYFPSKLPRSTSNQARNHLAQNSSQQLASDEYSLNHTGNRTMDPAKQNSKDAQKPQILNLNSFHIPRSSHNSDSTAARKINIDSTKPINDNLKKPSIVGSLNNLHQSLRNLQQLSNSAFVQPGGVVIANDANPSEDVETARSIYHKILGDYALKPNYSSRAAQSHRELPKKIETRPSTTQEAAKSHRINTQPHQPNFERIAIYSQSPRHLANTHHIQNPMRQAYASSFEYGANSNNITLSKELEKIQQGVSTRPEPLMISSIKSSMKYPSTAQLKLNQGQY